MACDPTGGAFGEFLPDDSAPHVDEVHGGQRDEVPGQTGNGLPGAALSAGHAGDERITNEVTELVKITQVSDDIVEAWTRILATIPVKKRERKFKEVTKNSRGEFCKVKFVSDGINVGNVGVITHFMVKANAVRKGHGETHDDWIPCLSLTQANEITRRWAMMLGKIPHQRNRTAGGRMEVREHRDEESILREYRGAVKRNQTGNHSSRNRVVKVPTDPGQPVRD